MTIHFIYVGKKLPAPAHDIYSEYCTRMSRWVQIQEIAVNPSKLPDKSLIIADESKRIIDALPSGCFVVALDERGKQYTSSDFSERFNQWRAQQKPLFFIIGGAFGFDESVRSKADVVWSLSQLVFPHELVRVLLAEQLYRALTIEHGMPYHHA